MTYKFKGMGVGSAMKKVEAFCKEASTDYILMVAKAKQKRSLAQNKYYWGVVVKVISDYTGFTPQETHQLLGRELWSYDGKNGHRFIKSTADMDIAEFSSCIENARQYANESIGVYVPEAGEITEEMYMTLNPS